MEPSISDAGDPWICAIGSHPEAQKTKQQSKKYLASAEKQPLFRAKYTHIRRRMKISLGIVLEIRMRKGQNLTAILSTMRQ
jgi:hypothetical protein